ncbi:MAG: amidohydrolase family protein [Ancrocorticia sp.]|jgi:N-acetylglucosamine-6-phosphate deacetylase|nr:amidohydrolase family protein [Ancrocorticia sp.]
MYFVGEVLDGFGKHVGSGLEINADGALVRILPIGSATEAPAGAIVGTHIVPGMVDVHCHGGGGASFPDDLDERSIRAAITAHRSKGTTALVASLVSMVDPLPAIEALVPFCESGELAGIHMEGPYISVEKKGAQNPAAIRGADLAELESYLKAGKGWIRTMTIAPETTNAAEAAKLLLRYGAKPSWGHTNADGATTAAVLQSTLEYADSIGFDSVPQTATHLFNGMPSLHHREPGPVRELIQAARRGEAAVEFIADGVHVKPILVEDITRYIADAVIDDPEAIDHETDARIDPELATIFVTDAMAAAGMPEGQYQLGGLDVTVVGNAARLTGGDALAGGCSRLSEQLTLLARRGVLSLAAIVCATVAGPTYAASLLREGREAKGVTLEFIPGDKPNFMVLNNDYEPIVVVREGQKL